MGNLTISVDDAVLKQARMRALEQGTSVNAVLAEYLERYAAIRAVQENALEQMFRIADEASVGPRRGGGRAWTRESLYEERIGRHARR